MFCSKQYVTMILQKPSHEWNLGYYGKLHVIVNNKILKHVIMLQWSTNNFIICVCGLCANVLFHFTMHCVVPGNVHTNPLPTTERVGNSWGWGDLKGQKL